MKAQNQKIYPESCVLTLRVLPGASKNEICGILSDGTVKLKIKAPALEGKANRELVRYLQKIFGLSASEVELISGFTGRQKQVKLQGVSMEQANLKINEQIIGIHGK